MYTGYLLSIVKRGIKKERGKRERERDRERNRE